MNAGGVLIIVRGASFVARGRDCGVRGNDFLSDFTSLNCACDVILGNNNVARLVFIQFDELAASIVYRSVGRGVFTYGAVCAAHTGAGSKGAPSAL